MKAELENVRVDIDDVKPGDMVLLADLSLKPPVELSFFSTIVICAEDLGMALGGDLFLCSIRGGSLMKLARGALLCSTHCTVLHGDEHPGAAAHER